ncbi:MAG TPA: hypothetical protein VF453_07250 [Burkholderiaceae bacterium]
MGKLLNDTEVKERAAARGLTPGCRLWAAGAKIDGDCFRKGNGPKNPAIYLRWSDIGVRGKSGKIEGDDLARATVDPGDGLSLFIEQTVQGNFTQLGSSPDGAFGKAYLEKLAKEEGYTEVSQIHWFKLAERTIPVGLEVVYDGHPPGHCTLTVTRSMTVGEFVSLVGEHLGFDYAGSDIYGPRG